MTTATLAPELLTRTETVKILRCSLKHLDNMIAKGQCPKPIRLGKAPRFRKAELLEWIAAGCPAVKAAG